MILANLVVLVILVNLVTMTQKIYGLHGLKHHIVEMRGGVTRRDDKRQTTNEQTREDRATQPLGCRMAEFRN